MPGNPYDGHTRAEALEQAAIPGDVQPEIAVVERGYKGVAVEGVKVYHPGLSRGITRGQREKLYRIAGIRHSRSMFALRCMKDGRWRFEGSAKPRRMVRRSGNQARRHAPASADNAKTPTTCRSRSADACSEPDAAAA